MVSRIGSAAVQSTATVSRFGWIARPSNSTGGSVIVGRPSSGFWRSVAAVIAKVTFAALSYDDVTPISTVSRPFSCFGSSPQMKKRLA